ncbi:MAG: hypothetical protein AB8G05_27085 [Oligoflexales bacterium]
MKKIIIFLYLFSFKHAFASDDFLMYCCLDFGSDLSRVIDEFRNSGDLNPDFSFDIVVNTDSQDLPIHTLYKNIINYASPLYGSVIPEKVVVKEIFKIMSNNQMRFLRYEQIDNQFKELSSADALSKIAFDLNFFYKNSPSA